MPNNNQLNAMKDKRKLLPASAPKDLYQFAIELATTWADTTANINYLKALKIKFKGRVLKGKQAEEYLERLAIALTARPGSAADIATLRSLKTQAKLVGFKGQTMVELMKVLTANNP